MKLNYKENLIPGGWMKITVCLLCLLCLVLPAKAVAAEKQEKIQEQIASEGDIIMTIDNAEPVTEDTLPAIEKMPEVRVNVEADYPPEIYKKGIEGTVVLDLVINESGSVDSVSVVKSINPILDSCAIRAAHKTLFSPAIAGGKPTAVIMSREYPFALSDIAKKIEEHVNFSGKLIERGTRKPIADAMVVLNFIDTLSDTSLSIPFSLYRQHLGSIKGQYVEGDRVVTVTDSLGMFQFKSLPCCTVEVTMPVTGYEELKEREFIKKGEELNVNYYMSSMSTGEYEITVYGKVEEKEVSHRQLTLSEVKKIPGFGGDAVKVVQALPGVARPTFGGAEIVVRGAPTDDSRFFLDGVEIPLLFHFGGLKSTYNSDALESVNFYPGGFGTRYGGAVAGVVEITGRRPKTDRWHGYLDANFMDGSVFVEGPINSKVSVLAEGRRSFIGDLIGLAAKASPTTTILTTAPYYWDYIARTDIDISKSHHAYVTFFGVKDGLRLVSSGFRGGSNEIDGAKNSLNIDLTFNMGLIGWNWNASDYVKNNFVYSLTYSKSQASIAGFFKTESDNWAHYLRDQLSLTFTDKLKFNLGADVQVMPLDMYLITSGEDNEIYKDTTNEWLFGVVGGYMNAEFKLLDRLILIPGIRYDYYPELTYNGSIVPEFWDYQDTLTGSYSAEPSVRMNGRYELSKNQFLKFAVGTYNETPKPLGQTIHKRWGDPSLGVTRAAQYVIGHELRITDLVHSDVQAYYNKQWDVARTATNEDLGAKPYIGDGKKKMVGLEVTLRHDQSENFFGWISYSLSQSLEYDFLEKRYVLYRKDQTHNLIAVGSWRLPENWEAGFKFQFTSGDPETPVVGMYLNEVFQFYQAEYGDKNSSRLNPTCQLDLRIDKKIVFKKWMLSAYIDFFNINYFLYKSPQTSIYGAIPYNYKTMKPNRTFAYQYSLPSIGLKCEF